MSSEQSNEDYYGSLSESENEEFYQVEGSEISGNEEENSEVEDTENNANIGSFDIDELPIMKLKKPLISESDLKKFKKEKDHYWSSLHQPYPAFDDTIQFKTTLGAFRKYRSSILGT